MRCNSCGWVNPMNNDKCDKCNTPLNETMNEANDAPAQEKQFFDSIEPKETTKCCPECGYPVGKIEKKCPQCRHIFNNNQDTSEEKEEAVCYEEPPLPHTKTPDIPKTGVKNCAFCNSPISETARFCINCGVSLVNEKKKQNATMMPWLHTEIQTPKCSLAFIPRDGEPTNDASLRFSGNVIQLNRGNTEPANQTITSKIQAELRFENDQWYIQDKSDLKTTYIYAGEKTALKSGDIIVIGNRLFEFNSDSVDLSK